MSALNTLIIYYINRGWFVIALIGNIDILWFIENAFFRQKYAFIRAVIKYGIQNPGAESLDASFGGTKALSTMALYYICSNNNILDAACSDTFNNTKTSLYHAFLVGMKPLSPNLVIGAIAADNNQQY
jgi:hypothetical protein